MCLTILGCNCSGVERTLRNSRLHELTDAAWAVVEPQLVSCTKRRGFPLPDHRTVVDGIVWVLAAGVPWRDEPE